MAGAPAYRLPYLHHGSSPRMRGTPCPNGCQVLLTRFIPSYAGNAANTRPTVSPTPVHPRMRGERTVAVMIRSAPYGSSPHARGTPPISAASSAFRGFIPTCAGNALVPGQFAGRVSGHPRMHGERIANGRNKLDKFGSSSHTRGTRLLAHQRRKVGRFIPAYAGNAWARPSPWTPSTVHPRMRGERVAGYLFLDYLAGSSPHARGTLHALRHIRQVRRFIPACAGDATFHRNTASADTVHPRMRGERGISSSTTSGSTGSSPHARGTRLFSLRKPARGWFIPACAGNARRRRCPSRPVSVHPRMRGERSLWSHAIASAAGSSPHARGTHGHGRGKRLDARFIPACAGNAR